MRVIAATITLLAGIVLGAAFSVAFAWTGPTGTAPGNNVAAPINVGSTPQNKNGNLGVNALAVFGDTLFSGLVAGTGRYLNFDYTADGSSGVGAAGYGIRDHAGTLEFKNTGGTWNNLTNWALNTLTAGVVTSIKFSDGTTQTTAVNNYLTNGSVTSIKFSGGTTQATAASGSSNATQYVAYDTFTAGWAKTAYPTCSAGYIATGPVFPGNSWQWNAFPEVVVPVSRVQWSMSCGGQCSGTHTVGVNCLKF